MLGLVCKVVGHRRSSRVWHDSVDFRSKCVRCKVPMLRSEHGWRPFEMETDASPLRQGKPPS